MYCWSFVSVTFTHQLWRKSLPLLLGCLLAALPAVSSATQKPVGILISSEIGPYIEMVEGFESDFSGRPAVRLFLDSDGQVYSLEQKTFFFDSAEFSALVAVGPPALKFLMERVDETPLLYGMVYDLKSLVPESGKSLCGIGLSLPPSVQLREIQKNLPGVTRVGVLFDPENNQSWYQNAAEKAQSLGMELVPLQLENIGESFKAVHGSAPFEAILFIPDKTIISKAIIEYVIRESVVNKTPVIGYNQFFLSSGAAISFVVDYSQVGRELAAATLQLLNTNECHVRAVPPFTVRRNDAVFNAVEFNFERGGSYE